MDADQLARKCLLTAADLRQEAVAAQRSAVHARRASELAIERARWLMSRPFHFTGADSRNQAAGQTDHVSDPWKIGPHGPARLR
jgi:hypothetical protein